MKLPVTLTLATLISLGSLWAEQPAAPAAPQAQSASVDPAALSEAKKLLQEMDFKTVYKKIVDQATENVIRRQPRLASVKDKIRAFYEKYIGFDAIKDDLARIYARNFTAKELQDIEAFYKTPTGKKALSITPKIMAQGRQLGMQKIIAHIDELKSIVMEAMAPKASQAPAKK